MGLGCDRSAFEPPVPQSPPPPVEPVNTIYGGIEVKIATSGEDLDPDGFVLQFDSPWDYELDARSVATNGTVTVARVSPGNHWLTLLGVAANCAGESLTDRPIVIKPYAVTAVSFQLVCTRITPTGASR
jgi:hypothetical protein